MVHHLRATALRVSATLAVAACAALALAAPASATTIAHFTYKGEAAWAQFYTQDGCIANDAYVMVMNGSAFDTVAGRSRQSVASVGVSTYDVCTWDMWRSAYGSVDLAKGQFTAASTLTSASLSAHVPLYDTFSGEAVAPVDIHLAWTGSVMSRSTYHNKWTYPDGSKVVMHAIGVRADPAIATGSMFDGTTEFASGPSYYAYLANEKSGSISITR